MFYLFICIKTHFLWGASFLSLLFVYFVVLRSHSLQLYHLENVSYKIPKHQGEEKYVVSLLQCYCLPIPTMYEHCSHITIFIPGIFFTRKISTQTDDHWLKLIQCSCSLLHGSNYIHRTICTNGALSSVDVS